MERSGENPERCGYCEKIYVNIDRIAGKQGSLKKNVEEDTNVEGKIWNTWRTVYSGDTDECSAGIGRGL